MRNNRVYGYQWGKSGTVYPLKEYTLKGAIQAAQAQGRAAYASGYKNKVNVRKAKKGRIMVKKHKRKGKYVKKHWRQLK